MNAPQYMGGWYPGMEPMSNPDTGEGNVGEEGIDENMGHEKMNKES